jgi:hypothetical protein
MIDREHDLPISSDTRANVRELSRMSLRSSGLRPCAVADKRPTAQFELCSLWLNLTNLQQNLARSPCPDFAARLFAQTPLASSLPQDLSRALMFEPCAKRRSGRKSFAAFDFRDAPRTAHRPRRRPNFA